MSQKRDRVEEDGLAKDELELYQPPHKKRMIEMPVQSFRMFDQFSSPALVSKSKMVPPVVSDDQVEDILEEISRDENSLTQFSSEEEEERKHNEEEEEEMVEFSSPSLVSKSKMAPTVVSDDQVEDILEEISRDENSLTQFSSEEEEERNHNEEEEEEMVEDSCVVGYDCFDGYNPFEQDCRFKDQGSQTTFSRKITKKDETIAILEIEIEKLQREKEEWKDALEEIENNTDIILQMSKNSLQDENQRRFPVNNDNIVPPPPLSSKPNVVAMGRKQRKFYQTSIDKYVI